MGALGDIVGPDFDLVFRAKGSGTITAGIIVAFDSSGNVIPATASTLGKHGVLTALTHPVSGTTYYGVLVRGKILAKSGGAIKPNKWVESDASGDAVTISDTPVSTAFVQGEIQDLYGRIFARYVRKDGDNQYAASDAADDDTIVLEVGTFA